MANSKCLVAAIVLSVAIIAHITGIRAEPRGEWEEEEEEEQ